MSEEYIFTAEYSAKEKLGDRIKNFRKKKGYTAKYFSEKIGIPYSTYSNYENNNRMPNFNTLIKISEGLDIDINRLLGYINITQLIESDPETTKEIEKEILKMYGNKITFKTSDTFVVESEDELKSKILGDLDLLNIIGKKKLVEYSKDLAKIPEYRKDTDKDE